MESFETWQAGDVAEETAKAPELPVLVALPDGRFVGLQDIAVVGIEITKGSGTLPFLLLIAEGAPSLHDLAQIAVTNSEPSN